MSGRIIAGIMLIITLAVIVTSPEIAAMAKGLNESNWIAKAFSAFKGE